MKKKIPKKGGPLSDKYRDPTRLTYKKPDPIKWADHIGPAQYSDPFEFCENKEK